MTPTIAMCLGGVSIVILASVTAYLMYLNWNSSLLTPLASSLAVGLFTLFLTLMFTLKEETFDTKFVTTVVIDKTNNLPPMLALPIAKNEVRDRYSNYASLARLPKKYGPNPEAIITPPKTDDEVFCFCNELVQYKMLKSLQPITRHASGMDTEFTGTRLTLKLINKTPVQTQDAIEMKGLEFVTNPQDSRFFTSEVEQKMWQMLGVKLPKGTSVTLSHIPTSATTGPEKRLLSITKPGFFVLKIEIEALLGGGNGALISAVQAEPDKVKTCQTFAFDVTCTATFERWTSGNSLTEGYKAWAKDLFAEFKTMFADE